MSLKICEKCGEEVEEAKAFCPDCGNPFVEEREREESSEFDNYAGTMNFSKSVYKMMLEDLDMDTSKQREKEVIEPVKPKQIPVEQIPVEQIPVEQIPVEQITPKKVSPQETITEQQLENENNSARWIVLAAVGLLLIFLFVAVILVALYFYFS